MLRARLLKPGFFKNEDLTELGPYAMLLYAGLWLIADREGRLEDRPKRIKVEILPYFDNQSVDKLLNSLAEAGFITRYTVAGNRLIALPTWSKHQHPHHMEAASTIPGPGEDGLISNRSQAVDESITVSEQVVDGSSTSRDQFETNGSRPTSILYPVSSSTEKSKRKQKLVQTPPALEPGAELKPTKRRKRDILFDVFWDTAVWEKVGGKIAAKAEWDRHAKDEATALRIIEAAKRQGPSILVLADARTPRQVLHPRKWLKDGRYDDEGVNPLLTGLEDERIDREAKAHAAKIAQWEREAAEEAE